MALSLPDTMSYDENHILLIATPAWVKVFRINPEFRILKLTFHRSQPQIAERMIIVTVASLINY